MVFGAFGDGDVFLWLLWFFMFVIWFWLLIVIFGDLFRDHELNGWAKAFWVLFIIILPFLGILVYLIARGGGMSKRAQAAAVESQQQMDAYVRSVSGTSASAADEIAKLKGLLDAGTISQAEYDQLKAKALS